MRGGLLSLTEEHFNRAPLVLTLDNCGLSGTNLIRGPLDLTRGPCGSTGDLLGLTGGPWGDRGTLFQAAPLAYQGLF